MDAVVEVNEIGQVVDAGPGDGLAGPVTLAHGKEHRGAGPDLGMAVHADLGGRDAGEGGVLDRGVAVAAIDPQAGDVVLVAERHRLLAGDADAGGVSGALQLGQDPEKSRDNEDETEDTDLGEGVETPVEDLGHVRHPPGEADRECRQTTDRHSVFSGWPSGPATLGLEGAKAVPKRRPLPRGLSANHQRGTGITRARHRAPGCRLIKGRGEKAFGGGAPARWAWARGLPRG